jgi:hypothetical protein
LDWSLSKRQFPEINKNACEGRSSNMTGRELRKILNELSEEVLDYDLVVTAGCDENGNGEFFPAVDFCCVGGGMVDAAADGVLEEGTPVILFGEDKI